MDDSTLVDPIAGLDVNNLISQVFHALSSKNWMMLVAAGLMLFMFAVDMWWARKLPDNKRSKVLPWVAVSGGVVIQFSSTLATSHSYADAINMALVTGTAATGLWSLVGKTVLGPMAPISAAANPNRQILSDLNPQPTSAPVVKAPPKPLPPETTQTGQGKVDPATGIPV